MFDYLNIQLLEEPVEAIDKGEGMLKALFEAEERSCPALKGVFIDFFRRNDCW